MYLTYLLVGLYIGIIVWGTTDLQLLRKEPVALPLLNVDLPWVSTAPCRGCL